MIETNFEAVYHFNMWSSVYLEHNVDCYGSLLLKKNELKKKCNKYQVSLIINLILLVPTAGFLPFSLCIVALVQ